MSGRRVALLMVAFRGRHTADTSFREDISSIGWEPSISLLSGWNGCEKIVEMRTMMAVCSGVQDAGEAFAVIAGCASNLNRLHFVDRVKCFE